jgi:hypothetical protein
VHSRAPGSTLCVRGFADVDIEALKDLGPRLRALRIRLDQLGQNLACFQGAVGSRRINHRLEEVAGNWRHHRERLGTELETLAAIADAAAATYRQKEAEIAGAVNACIPPTGD